MQSIISASLPVTATPKGVTQLTYIRWRIPTMKRRPQDVTENMYLNDNKCNTMTEDGAIKTIWSGNYSQLLNETKRKGNCRMREILKKKYLRYP